MKPQADPRSEIIFSTIAVRREDREKVASWMMANGFATGHGDTIDDLLAELRWQIMESRYRTDALEPYLEYRCSKCGMTWPLGTPWKSEECGFMKARNPKYCPIYREMAAATKKALKK